MTHPPQQPLDELQAEAIERALRIRIWNSLRESGVGQTEAIRRVNAEIETIKASALSSQENKDGR